MRFFNHPNVIKLYEVLENTTDIFIVMELAPEGAL
jgi:5'-AMP-activated protein kinase catalytic alpha subunit